MAKLIVYYAHPGHKHSHVNKHMARAAARISGITFVDLYADYPRFDINVKIEQQRLLDHDVILFQFPVFWYSLINFLTFRSGVIIQNPPVFYQKDSVLITLN